MLAGRRSVPCAVVVRYASGRVERLRYPSRAAAERGAALALRSDKVVRADVEVVGPRGLRGVM